MRQLGIIYDEALAPLPALVAVSPMLPGNIDIQSAAGVTVAVPRLSDWYPPQIFVDGDQAKGVSSNSIGKAYLTAVGAPSYHSDMMTEIDALFGSAASFITETDAFKVDPTEELDNSAFYGNYFLFLVGDLTEKLAGYQSDLSPEAFRALVSREAGRILTGVKLQDLNWQWQALYQEHWSDGAMQLWPYIRYDYVSYELPPGVPPKIWSWGLFLCPLIPKHRELLAVAKAQLDKAFDLRASPTLFEQLMGATLGSRREQMRIWYGQFLDYYEETTGIRTSRAEDQPGLFGNWGGYIRTGLWIAGGLLGVYTIAKIADIARGE